MIASFVLGASVVLLAPPKEIQRSIDAFVSHAPGAVVAVGVIDHGKTHMYFAGTPPIGAPKLDDRAEFQIGSITKTFTGTLLAEMSLRGEVHVDDPIEKYLPANAKAPTFEGKHITLLNLAEQNSGLPALPTNFHSSNVNDPYAEYSQTDLYAFLAEYQLTRAPGAQFEYSNLGVGLLGTLLANAAHTSYDRLLAQRVFSPLGMTESSAVLTPQISAKMVPGFTMGMEPAPPWTFPSLAGCGAVNSNLHDMLIYLAANINAPQGPLGPAMALAHQPRTPSLPAQQIGLNWIVSPSGVVWHNGSTGGYSSILMFSKADDAGVVVLNNVEGANQFTDALGAHIFESARYPSAPMLGGGKPHGDTPFAGVYRFRPNFAITIFEENGTLYGSATKQPTFVLTLRSGTTYTVEGFDASITFEKDPSGRVTSLVLHQNGVDQTAPLITSPVHER